MMLLPREENKLALHQVSHCFAFQIFAAVFVNPVCSALGVITRLGTLLKRDWLEAFD